MQVYMETLIYMVGFLFLLLVLRIFRGPLRLVLRLVASSLLGGAGLILLNTFGESVGLGIAVNPFTALVAGLLGLPGIAVLLVLQLIL